MVLSLIVISLEVRVKGEVLTVAYRICTLYPLPQYRDQHQPATSLTSVSTTLPTAFSIPATLTSWLFLDHTRHTFALKPLLSLVLLPRVLFPSSIC